MHKKIFLSLLTASLMIAGGSASAWAQETDSLPQSLEEVEDTVIMNVEDLLDIYDAVGCNTIEHHGDGTVFSWYCYYSKDLSVLEDSTGYIELFSEETNYIYDADTDTPGCLLFPTEENKEQYRASLYDNSSYQFEGEEMVSITEDEDGISLVTRMDESAAETYLASIGYDTEGAETVQWTYQIDPETQAITSSAGICINEDGTETTLIERVLNTEPEEYEISTEILDRLNAEDTRTCTVIIDPGTEQERSVSETVGKGCGVAVYAGDAVFYVDEACTEEQIPSAETEEDMILYTTTEELTGQASAEEE